MVSDLGSSYAARFGVALLTALCLHGVFLFFRTSKASPKPPELALLNAAELFTIETLPEGGGSPLATQEDPKKAGMQAPPVESEHPVAPSIVKEKAAPARTVQPTTEERSDSKDDAIHYDELVAAEFPLDDAALTVPSKAARATLIRATGSAARRGLPIKGRGPGAGGGDTSKRKILERFEFGGPTGAFSAQVCSIAPGTTSLTQIGDCPLLATFQTDRINISARKFSQGFPGVSDRSEWFAIKYTGEFEARRSGKYRFRLLSDDGSQLYIDGAFIIDNDGEHEPRSVSAAIHLEKGRHEFVVKYFQGPRFTLALQLFVTPPGRHEQTFRPRF